MCLWNSWETYLKYLPNTLLLLGHLTHTSDTVELNTHTHSLFPRDCCSFSKIYILLLQELAHHYLVLCLPSLEQRPGCRRQQGAGTLSSRCEANTCLSSFMEPGSSCTQCFSNPPFTVGISQLSDLHFPNLFHFLDCGFYAIA